MFLGHEFHGAAEPHPKERTKPRMNTEQPSRNQKNLTTKTRRITKRFPSVEKSFPAREGFST
ncbi:MAG: hypothetical protein DMG08_00590 [Acidobacteria bacterium]|nr:MAG: hypothetical protein DMG08_00590 [Acidobacteriota bacterium]PYV39313.1 MAG: hypothetical protein DMG09_09505 [Acidobacteriota bacterium]